MTLRASIIYTIFIALLIHSYISQEICNYYNDCTCTFCGENEDYTTCDFINLFCENGTNVFTSKFLNLKNRYMNYFKKEKDNEIFCGLQKDVEIKDNTETAIIKTGKSYTKGKPVHCYYNVNYNNYKKYNPLMTYEILDNGANKLNFDLIVLYQNTTDNETELFTYEELKLGPYSINVTNYDKVELFLDFKANDYSHIDEVFTVKVKLNLKEGEIEEDSSNNNTLIGGIGGSIAGLILIVGIAYCCCCREKTYEVQEKSSCAIF